MVDLSVIILTFNEEIHIERCIRSLQPLTSEIILIDSFSTDRTVAIAKLLGAKVYQHKFVNQADQFQWGLDNLACDTQWIMRLDADEYLELDLQEEINLMLPLVPDEIDGIYIKRKVFFQNRWIRYGGFYPHILLRIWRTGKGRVEQRWMDEHIVLQPGSKTILAKEHMVDDNHKGITFWINKHNQYASREAVDMLNIKYALLPKDTALVAFDDPQAKAKRNLKEKLYARLPVGLRAFLYFCYRYFLRLGFLDGSQGFIWHFMQGFWYRLLVDVKITEIERHCAGNIEMMKELLRKDHGIYL